MEFDEHRKSKNAASVPKRRRKKRHTRQAVLDDEHLFHQTSRKPNNKTKRLSVESSSSVSKILAKDQKRPHSIHKNDFEDACGDSSKKHSSKSVLRSTLKDKGSSTITSSSIEHKAKNRILHHDQMKKKSDSIKSRSNANREYICYRVHTEQSLRQSTRKDVLNKLRNWVKRSTSEHTTYTNSSTLPKKQSGFEEQLKTKLSEEQTEAWLKNSRLDIEKPFEYLTDLHSKSSYEMDKQQYSASDRHPSNKLFKKWPFCKIRYKTTLIQADKNQSGFKSKGFFSRSRNQREYQVSKAEVIRKTSVQSSRCQCPRPGGKSSVEEEEQSILLKKMKGMRGQPTSVKEFKEREKIKQQRRKLMEKRQKEKKDIRKIKKKIRRKKKQKKRSKIVQELINRIMLFFRQRARRQKQILIDVDCMTRVTPRRVSCLWVYKYCFPWCYPYAASCKACYLFFFRSIFFLIAIAAWLPCVLCFVLIEMAFSNMYGHCEA